MKLSRNVIAPLFLAALIGPSLAHADASGDGHEKQAAPHDQAWLEKKTQVCAGCHGKNGVSQTPSFPTLAGQYQDYLLHSLKGYRDGERKNAVMAGQVTGLTDAQLKALARYYANQESALYTPAMDE